jgi:hypothetical protein
MKCWVLLLLLLCCCCCWAQEDDRPPEEALELLLYRGQYIQTMVSGRDHTLRIRFDDCDKIYLYETITDRAPEDYVPYPRERIEEFTFGPSKTYHWRAVYTGGGRDTIADPPVTDGKITHHGVFCLSPTSDIWRDFDSWTIAPSRLVLGWMAPRLDTVVSNEALSIHPEQDASALTNVVELSLPYPLAMNLHVEMAKFTEQDLPSRISLGMPFEAMVLARNMSEPEGTWHLGSCRVHVLSSMQEYIWLFAALLMTGWVWFPAFAEIYHRAYWNEQRERSIRMLQNNWSLYSSCFIWIALLSLAVIHGTLESRHWMRLLLHEPYGAGNSVLSQVVYWVIVGAVLASIMFLNPKRMYDECITHRASCLYLLGWLALVPDECESANMIGMIVMSVVCFMRQSALLLRTLYRRRSNNAWWLTVMWGTSALLTAWFLGFYTVSHFVYNFWPGHPAKESISVLLVAIVWCMFSVDPFIKEHINHIQQHVADVSKDPRLAHLQTRQHSDVVRGTSVPVSLPYAGVQ